MKNYINSKLNKNISAPIKIHTIKMNYILLALFALLGFMIPKAWADQATVAVAANFSGPMEKIIPAFQQSTGHKLVVAYGGTGKFYAQIKNGAPFDILVSADDETPIRLEKEDLAIPESRFTYAIGQLALWSTQPGLVDNQGKVLAQGQFKHLAIASPKLAPYGAAALSAIQKMGLETTLKAKLVYGENITQAYQFTATSNAELGFVALSQIYKDGQYAPGSYWLVPPALYPTIRQDAILLVHGKNNPAATAFLAYLQSDAAKQVIRAHGYLL